MMDECSSFEVVVGGRDKIWLGSLYRFLYEPVSEKKVGTQKRNDGPGPFFSLYFYALVWFSELKRDTHHVLHCYAVVSSVHFPN
jgi:hypothetical protein